MRKIDYEKFANEKKERAETVWKLRGGRLPRRRPRSKEESAILLKLDVMRQEEWLKSGKLQILAPRKFRIRVEG